LDELMKGLNCPAVQFRHGAALPLAGAYVPARQLVHDDAPGPETEPTPHRPHDVVALPNANRPGMHGAHDADPGVFVALPGAHGVHDWAPRAE
jgi:hypothetical protein